MLPRSLHSLLNEYAGGTLVPERVLEQVVARIEETRAQNVWIATATRDALARQLTVLHQRKREGAELPLYGVPFAVKDNIDVAGFPTTAACPSFAYLPEHDAPVVARLRSAGAIVVGKTNMDQFATGLVGTRSPYGAVPCVFDEGYISGGSSSGSAVAVANGSVSFALGTDTAGSGRVPAAFNNLVGLKPTRGRLSTRGVVPACRSLDCVSVFATCTADAAHIASIASDADPQDPFSRPYNPSPSFGGTPRVGILGRSARQFFGDEEAERLYDACIGAAQKLGADVIEIDFAPFAEAATLLYQGSWVAERFAAVGDFVKQAPEGLDPTVGSIILGGETLSASQAFRDQYQLARLRRSTERTWQLVDCLLLPTTPTTFTIDAVREDPVGCNSRLGLYTNFVNLFDLAAVAIPAGFRSDGLALGITLMGLAHSDDALLTLAGRLHATLDPELQGALTDNPTPRRDALSLLVVGAHLAGQPLNHQLTSLGGTLLKACRTAPDYRLYHLAGSTPPKPGLARDASHEGGGIEAELWGLPAEGFARFVSAIPAPLGVGKVTLDDGSEVTGFICEPRALNGARDISEFGGWRAYLASLG